MYSHISAPFGGYQVGYVIAPESLTVLSIDLSQSPRSYCYTDVFDAYIPTMWIYEAISCFFAKASKRVFLPNRLYED